MTLSTVVYYSFYQVSTGVQYSGVVYIISVFTNHITLVSPNSTSSTCVDGVTMPTEESPKTVSFLLFINITYS